MPEDKTYAIQVEEDRGGARLDRFLADRLPDMSRSYIQKLIKENVHINGRKALKPGETVKGGDVIHVTVPAPEMADIKPQAMDLDIRYEDDDILIVNKPKGLVVHPSAGHPDHTLVNGLLYHCRDSLSSINGVLRPGIVHRIDKDTTGLLIVCKNDAAHQSIADQLKVHSITRKYHAIVYGDLKADSGTINAPIGRHGTDRKKMAVNPKNGKEAVTHYRVLKRFGAYTYVECTLETGRTHQIRVHMASIGHPLLGDTVYGPSRQPFKLEGQTLHAKVFGFVHPTTGTYMEFDSELPDYFKDLLVKLEKRYG